MTDEMIKTLGELCSFQSVAERSGDISAPWGSEVNRALQYMLSLCESFGFRTKNCDDKIGWAEIGSQQEIFGILVHLDVVPAGEGWDYEPYSATLAGERIYGRGVTDDKGPAVACVYAMRDLLQSGIPLTRRIRIIFGQTEETGEWEDMEFYKATEELPVMGFTPDADFPAVYGEKGIAIITLSMQKERSGLKSAGGGQAPNMVPDWASAEVETSTGVLKISAAGVAAHGSTPEDGENAISRLMTEIASAVPECRFAEFYNRCIGFDMNGNLAGIPLCDRESGKLTMNAGMLSMTEETADLTLDIRYPVTCTIDQIMEGLSHCVGPFGVTARLDNHMPPIYMAKDSELMTKLISTYRLLTGSDAEPIVMGGGTYARAMENIVAYGPMFPGRELTEHQKNEYILIDDLVRLRLIYREALKEICS